MHTKFDTYNDKCDLLREIRKNYFELNERQKNKISRCVDGVMIRFSYCMEYGKP